MNGLQYLHDSSVIHQDLKPPNILLDASHKIAKLADFGISTNLQQTIMTKNAGNGTMKYMAPEQFDDVMSSKLDIWQFGCLLLEMVTGKEPYCGLRNDFAMLKLQNDGVSPLDHILKLF